MTKLGQSGTQQRYRYLRRPPSHWIAFVLALVVVGAALLLAGVVDHTLGRSSTVARGDSVAELGAVGPVFDPSGSKILSASPSAGAVALTFDDGPDPHWTPEILQVLRRHHAKATFFMVGSEVARHPGVARDVVKAGSELGNHTFTHADLGNVSSVRAGFELALTETAIAGATGRNTSLLRLPYSSVPSAFTTHEFSAARTASKYGYLIVAATKDSEDWRRPGAAQIRDNAMPAGSEGAVVLMHDGGGNRAQTVTALDQLLSALDARGTRYVTVSELAGQRAQQFNPHVGLVARLQGLVLIGLVQSALVLAGILTWIIVPIGVLTVGRALFLLFFARRHSRTPRRRLVELPTVSVIIPAYNEEVGISASVTTIANNDYPDLEIVVVDDGSTDGTGDAVRELDLPNVRLITQPNAGKPAALNTGLANSTGEIVVMVDGDTVFEADTVRELVQPFGDPEVGAVSGNTKVGNRRGILGRWQHVEYVIGFNLDRRMYDMLQCMPTVPGAIGAFRRDALVALGGVSEDTLAEDTDLTMAFNRAGWRVVYEERARAWTEAPANLRSLWRQRYRWCYGTMQAMWKHRRAIRERSHLGVIALPYLLAFQVLLPLLAPFIDLYALYGVLFLNPVPVLGFWLAFNCFQVLLGAYAFRLDREKVGPLWTVPLQQFVYRQLMYLVVYQSVVSAVGGSRLRWHKLPRTGMPDLVADAPAEQAALQRIP